jgi:hypothetical protein
MRHRPFLAVSWVLVVGASIGCGSQDDGSEPSSDPPATCLDVRASDPDAADGEYTLFVERDPDRPWTAYCHDMDGMPATFLPLRSRDPSANASRLQVYDGDALAEVVTFYDRVRIDPRTLYVDIGDQTFTRQSGAAIAEDGGEVWSMPFGVAAACTADLDIPTVGKASIDLGGTGFALDGSFCLRTARDDVSNAWYSYNRTRVDLEVYADNTAECAVASPAPCLVDPFNAGGGFHLPLAYDAL